MAIKLRFTVLVSATLVTGTCAGSACGKPQQTDATETFSTSYQACITYGETHDTIAIPAAECNAREMRAQDARLNKTYKDAMARLSTARKRDLRAEERKWINARDQKCRKRPDLGLRTECQIGETIRHIAYLQRVR